MFSRYTRTGVPGVFGPTVGSGLPLTEVTLANQLKQAGYHTGIMGKWHLGQRPMFLPTARGFDEYLGIPFSDDMGEGRRTSCDNETVNVEAGVGGQGAWGRGESAGRCGLTVLGAVL